MHIGVFWKAPKSLHLQSPHDAVTVNLPAPSRNALAVGVLGVVSAAAVSQPHACTEDGDLHDLDVISHGDWYFNTRLAAPNVWEIDVSPETVDKAAALFNEIDLPLPVITAVPTNTSVKTASGASYFVSQNPFGSVSAQAKKARWRERARSAIG